MHRVTITIDDALMAELDLLIAARGYQNRSEAIRDLARAGLQQAAADTVPEQPCVAALVYVYGHARRELPKRLANAFHDHHQLAVSTLHVHLDPQTCMEVTVLKGAAGALRRFADHIIAERGVLHGRLVVLPAGAPHAPDQQGDHQDGHQDGHRHGH